MDQEEIVSRLKDFVKRGTMPHCLFAGPPGTGKTTAGLCLAHDLFGERFQDAFKDLNAKNENIKSTEGGLKTIVEVAEGDLRKAINILQAASSISKGISEETVYQVVGRARPTDVHEMLNHALKGDFLKARDELRNLLVKYGLSGSDIIRQIHSEVFRLAIPEKTRISLIKAIGDTDFRLVQGGDEEVQLSALLAHLAAQSSVHRSVREEHVTALDR